jgi:hypothetical protein
MYYPHSTLFLISYLADHFFASLPPISRVLRLSFAKALDEQGKATEPQGHFPGLTSTPAHAILWVLVASASEDSLERAGPIFFMKKES